MLSICHVRGIMRTKDEKYFQVIKTLYSHISYSKTKLFLMAFTLAFGTVGGIFLAATIGTAVQKVSSGIPFDFLSVVLPIIIAAVIELSTSFIYTHLSGRFSAEVQRQMSNLTLRKLLGSKQSWMEMQKSGDMINKSGESLHLASNLLANSVPDLLKTFFAIILMAVYLFINDWKLATIYFALYPLVIFMQNAFSRPIEKTGKERLAVSSKCSNIAIDALRNISTIKAYGLEEIMREKYSNKSIELQAKFRKFYWAKSLVCCIGEVFAVLPTFIVCFGAVYFVAKGTMEVGALLSFILVMLRLNSPLFYFGRQMADIRGDLAGAKRTITLWNSPQEDRDKAITTPKGGNEVINFKNISFSYENDNEVIKDISFTLSKGEHIAFVGESGCGKSTILKLIAGLYDSYAGRIEVMGHEIRDWQLLSMRNNMAYVSQQSDLFPVSLYDNVAWGSDNKTKEQVEGACESAGIYKFIKGLPQGFETLAGERGVRLSGGQNQRISIARAIIRDADLLLLDEATSSLDATTEKEVQTALNKLVVGKSTITVSHRLSSIREVDKIYVIENGKISEEGKHRELMAKKGVYYRLYNRQLEEDLA